MFCENIELVLENFVQLSSLGIDERILLAQLHVPKQSHNLSLLGKHFRYLSGHLILKWVTMKPLLISANCLISNFYCGILVDT